MIVHHGNLVRKKLKDEKSIRRNYGEIANGIQTCLSVLRIAENLEEVPPVLPTKRHKLTQNRKGCWGLWISTNWRLIIKPSSGEKPVDIVEVTIIDIEDYH